MKTLKHLYFIRILSLFILLILNTTLKGQTDSTFQRTNSVNSNSVITYRLALSGTYSAQHNWYNDQNNYKSIAFLFNGDCSYRLTTAKLKHNYSFRSNLGYFKIVDSVWIKNNDYWRLNATLIENQNKLFTHTYSLNARSQFLEAWKYVYDAGTDTKEKRLKSTFFNPAIITLAYGLSWSFWDFSYINFNFAAINFNTKPRFEQQQPNDHELAKTKKMYLYADYGMNLQTSIFKEITPYTNWENYTNFFTNGINKQQINLDFANKIIFKVIKFVQFTITNHILYDPLYSNKLQYQNDFTLGLVFDKRINKKKKP